MKHVVRRRVLPLVPDLHAVGAGHVGEGAPIGVQRDVLDTKAVDAAVGEVGIVAVDRRLLRHRGLVEDAVRRGRARAAVGRVGEPGIAGFEQDPVGQRIRPRAPASPQYGRSKYPRWASGEKVFEPRATQSAAR